MRALGPLVVAGAAALLGCGEYDGVVRRGSHPGHRLHPRRGAPVRRISRHLERRASPLDHSQRIRGLRRGARGHLCRPPLRSGRQLRGQRLAQQPVGPRHSGCRHRDQLLGGVQRAGDRRLPHRGHHRRHTAGRRWLPALGGGHAAARDRGERGGELRGTRPRRAPGHPQGRGGLLRRGGREPSAVYRGAGEGGARGDRRALWGGGGAVREGTCHRRRLSP